MHAVTHSLYSPTTFNLLSQEGQSQEAQNQELPTTKFLNKNRVAYCLSEMYSPPKDRYTIFYLQTTYALAGQVFGRQGSNSKITKFRYSDYSHWPPLTMGPREGAGVAEPFTA